MASDIHFATTLPQCGTATLVWTGGTPPLRIEFYQQSSPTGSFNGSGYVYDDPDNTGSLNWVVSAPSGIRIWATVTDHLGIYNQSLEPAEILPSGDDSCLLQVVDSQTFHNNSDTATYVGIGLGIPLALALMIILFLISRLRQIQKIPRARRTPVEKPRLALDTDSLAEDAAITSYNDGFVNQPKIVVEPPTPIYPSKQSTLASSPVTFTSSANPFADIHRAPSIESHTGTAREHMDSSSGVLQVRNTDDTV